MSFSDFLEDALLDHVFKVAAYTVPTNLYIALSTADPLDDNSGLAEPVGNGYARVLNNVNWASVAGTVNNSAAVTFPQASGGSWGTITHFAIFDAITAGNQLGSGALATSRLVNDGDTPEFAINDITVTLD